MQLIGNSFPLSLIRREVIITPCAITQLQECLKGDPHIASFWGHTNTVGAASSFLGYDLTPRTARPAITLNGEALPFFEGRSYETCWILSPDYVEQFRPAIGEEVPAEKIRSWQLVRIQWQPA